MRDWCPLLRRTAERFACPPRHSRSPWTVASWVMPCCDLVVPAQKYGHVSHGSFRSGARQLSGLVGGRPHRRHQCHPPDLASVRMRRPSRRCCKSSRTTSGLLASITQHARALTSRCATAPRTSDATERRTRSYWSPSTSRPAAITSARAAADIQEVGRLDSAFSPAYATTSSRHHQAPRHCR